MATATAATPAKPKTPVGSDPTPMPEEPDGPILRALYAAAPEASARAFEQLAARQVGMLVHASGGVHPQGLAAQISNIREKAATLRRTRARADYLAKLQAGGVAASGPFLAPDDDPQADAVETLRGLLGRGVHTFNGLVGLVDGKLAGWRAELDKDAARCDPATWVPDIASAAPAGDRFDPVAFLDSTRSTVLRAAELTDRVARLDAARTRLVETFGVRVAAAVKIAGGNAAVGQALLESARLSAASGDGTGLVQGHRDELAGVDAKLAKLGIDPSSAKTPGLAGQALLAKRSELTGRIDAATSSAASDEAAGHGSLVDEALAFSPSAWSKILASCRAEPSAFPAGFEAAWSSIPLDSLVEAGAAAFVEPFEAP